MVDEFRAARRKWPTEVLLRNPLRRHSVGRTLPVLATNNPRQSSRSGGYG